MFDLNRDIHILVNLGPLKGTKLYLAMLLSSFRHPRGPWRLHHCRITKQRGNSKSWYVNVCP